jgi:GT2 family glycosyltransferase
LVCFLVLEEESAALTHLLPKQIAKDCNYASASETSYKLVEANSTSRTAKPFDLLYKATQPKSAEGTPFVSVIVLNFNGKHFLERCLSSLQFINYPKDRYEVLLVDNGSTDGSVEYAKTRFPEVKTVVFPQNYGFGGGNNRAVRYAKGGYIAFLNNDTQVTARWLSELVEASVQHSIPICSSKTLFMKNPQLVEFGGGKFTVNGRGYSVGFSKANDHKNKCSFTGYACAASMLIKKDVFLDLCGFDSDYFSCLDDTDLGWRAWLFGYSSLYCPSSIVYHDFGGTISKTPSPLKVFHETKNPIITVLKNLESRHVFFGLVLAVAFDFVDSCSFAAKGSFECLRKKIDAYSWLVTNLSRIMRKRSVIQKRRVVSDGWLSDKGFLVYVWEAFREFRRLNAIR